MEKKIYKVYFAGGLFSSKDLIGNKLVAEAIMRISGKYKCLLPQDLEQRRATPKEIRDDDIKSVLDCDLGIFNYDGTELDSGTVVEYMLAKFADKPALLLRTDFRGGGDQTYGEDAHPWNLMTSFFPRTRVLILDSMKEYKIFLRDGLFDTQKYCEHLARMIIKELDELVKEKPLLNDSLAPQVNEWLKILTK